MKLFTENLLDASIAMTMFSIRRPSLWAVAVGLVTSACAFKDPPRQISYYVLDPERQQKQAEQEDKLIKQFYSAGGGSAKEIPLFSADDWWVVLNGAKYRIDLACNDYMAKLSRIDNERKTDLAALAIGGPAITTVATTAGAARDALAYLSVALGLVGAAPDITADHFLYGASPAALSRMVGAARAVAWNELEKVKTAGYLTSRPQTLSAIETYLRQCMPENIRALADQVLEKAAFERTPAASFEGQTAPTERTRRNLPEAAATESSDTNFQLRAVP